MPPPRRRPKPAPAPSGATDRWAPGLWQGTGLILLLIVVAYLPALHAGFVYDDDGYIVGNELLRSAHGLLQIWTVGVPGEHYWPVTYTVFWLQYHFWGVHAFGYHAVNVLLHAINCVLIWRLLVRTGVPGAWLAAAIFAVHPVHVESVAWAIELKDVLSGAFYLLAFHAYIRFAERGRATSYPGALVLFAAALLSKSIAITFPLAVLLWIWVCRRADVVRHLKALLPFVVVAAGTTAVDITWFSAIPEAVPLTVVDRATIAGRAFWFHGWKLVWPVGLSSMYPPWPVDPSQVVQWLPLALAAATAVVLLVLVLRRTWLRPAAALLFFGITIGPALGLMYHGWMRYSYAADRFQYLASIGPIALAAVALTRLRRDALAQGARVAAGALIVVFVALTWQQSAKYKDAETFYETLLTENPAAWFAHINLGVLLVDRGDVAGAIAHYREALRLKPDHFEARLNLAVALAQTGKTDEALDDFAKAHALRPDDAEVENFIGLTLANAGRPAEALPHYQEALRLQPSYADALNNLGIAFVDLGRRTEAIETFRAAIRIQPSHYVARENLATQLYLAGFLDEAMRQRAEAQRLRAVGGGS